MSDRLQNGQKAPDFSAKDYNGNVVSLKDFSSQWLVLYFYPKDDTPGCTTQARDFTQYSSEFNALGAQIVGISPDTEKSHCRFIDKHQLTIQLLSDREHQIAEIYGVWGLKKFMGKEYMGVIRSTFLIAPSGAIAHSWYKVRVKNHALEVLEQLKTLQ
jgi:thioredoxin-dependent peroxiredoxin